MFDYIYFIKYIWSHLTRVIQIPFTSLCLHLFKKRNTAYLGPDAPVQPPITGSRYWSYKGLNVRKCLPKDIILLLAPLSRDPGFGEEKTKRRGSKRMLNLGHLFFSTPHDSRQPYQCHGPHHVVRRTRTPPARHARQWWNYLRTPVLAQRSTTTKQGDSRSPAKRLWATKGKSQNPSGWINWSPNHFSCTFPWQWHPVTITNASL